MRTRTECVVVCVAALGILSSAVVSRLDANQTTAPPQPGVVLSPPSAMPWKPGSTPGVEQALLWGDRDQGANGTIARYPAGFEIRPHYHTHDMRGLIVSGTWVLGIVGGTKGTLPAGSYFFLPGKTAHTDRCEGPTPCVMFIAQDESRDTVFLEPSGR